MRANVLCLPVLFLTGCQSMSGSVESLDWGTLEGERIELFTLQNANGLVMKVTTYGATITELHVPDRSGDMADVVLGFDDLQGYLSDSRSALIRTQTPTFFQDPSVSCSGSTPTAPPGWNS